MAAPLLVLGTRNRKKGVELVDLLRPLGIEVRTLADYPSAIEVVEDADTFAGNAAKKATEQARHLGQWVLGEDSGLAVDALKGAPGVYSARYSGPGATDETNNRRLLAELEGTPLERRTAHYICHAALADPQGSIRATAEDRCQGRILFEPRGTGGFGYDPLFEVPEYHRTFGELGPAVKAALSHRARALRKLVPQIVGLLTPE
jgi:XTP/dITP diphosphohydrolase